MSASSTATARRIPPRRRTGPAPEAHAGSRRPRPRRGRSPGRPSPRTRGARTTPSGARSAEQAPRRARARRGGVRSRRRGASRVGSRGRVSARNRRGGRAGRGGDAHPSTDDRRDVLGHGRRRGSVERACRRGGAMDMPVCQKVEVFTFWRDFLARSFQSSLSENMSTKTARMAICDEEPRQSAFARSSGSRTRGNRLPGRRGRSISRARPCPSRRRPRWRWRSPNSPAG